MPRPRLAANATLPPRGQAIRRKDGTLRYYYRASGGRKIAPGSDANAMRVEWAQVTGTRFSVAATPRPRRGPA